jgi:flagellar motor switch protein FliG
MADAATLPEEPLDEAANDTLPAIKGSAAAAILLMTLEETDAAEVLKFFAPDELKFLGAAMFEAAQASNAEITAAMTMFLQQEKSMPTLAIGAEPRIRSMMSSALGNVRADNLLAAIAPKASESLLDLIRWMEIADIRELLAQEHPQAAAIILSVLTPEIAAAALSELDQELQSELVYRAARLETVSTHALSDLEDCVRQYSDRASEQGSMRLGGKSEIAKIVNRMSKSDGEKLLQMMRKRDKKLAAIIEEEMFVFEDLMKLDNKSVAIIVRNVEAETLGLALKGADEALFDKLIGTMSARAADTIRDEMAERQMVKRSQVDDARREIIAIARSLANSGEIMLNSAGDDYV